MEEKRFCEKEMQKVQERENKGTNEREKRERQHVGKKNEPTINDCFVVK